MEHTHIVSIFIMHKYIPSRAGKVISESFLRGLIRYFDGLFPVLLQKHFSSQGTGREQVEASPFPTYSSSSFSRHHVLGGIEETCKGRKITKM